jgi:DNA end-binding protein Ku
VLELIERKAAGEEIAIQPEAEEPAAAPDLMAALEASLAAVKEDKKPAPTRRKRTRAGSEDGAAKQPARSRR